MNGWTRLAASSSEPEHRRERRVAVQERIGFVAIGAACGVVVIQEGKAQFGLKTAL